MTELVLSMLCEDKIKKTTICNPGRTSSLNTEPVSALIWASQSPEL
jgi:hypothetical protein